jgi:hypothetical protein
MKLLFNLILLGALLVFYNFSFAQSVIIDPSSNSSIINATSSTKGVVFTRMNETERNNLISPTLGLQVYCTNCTAGEGPYSFNGSSWIPMFTSPAPSPTYTVGQLIFGGKVFYVDESGRHGLVAALSDQNGGTALPWFNGNFTNTKAVRFGVYSGRENTDLIVQNQGNGNYAAIIAAQYTGGGFGDWFLPSIEELNLLFAQRVSIGGFFTVDYWSSTEPSVAAGSVNTNAQKQSFNTGVQAAAGKDQTARIRAIRRF